MSTTTAEFAAGAERLMRLLPSVHQLLDAQPDGGGDFLRTLLGLIGEQVGELQDDLAALYDDLFIETCAPWAVPYIGDLVGVTPDHDVVGVSSTTTRAQVADIIALRRAKGTAGVVEQLAADVTGWPARVVEMFRMLAGTQHLDHLRPGQARTVSLRNATQLELVDGAFDALAHNIDVRWITTGRGRYNAQNLAVFLWPQSQMPFLDVEAVAVDAGRFRFHPLGFDTTLVTNPVPSTDIGSAATTAEVPWPISIRALDADLTSGRPPTELLYSDAGSIFVQLDGGPDLAASEVVACSLGDLGGTWEHLGDIPAGTVAIDPRRGRLAFGSGVTGTPIVTFHQTLTGPIGGGAYDRPAAEGGIAPTEVVSRADATAPHQTIAAALTTLGGSGVVQIDDSRTYVEALSTTVTADHTLELRASNGRRPLLRVGPEGLRVACADGASLVIDGLLIAGGPLVVSGSPAAVTVRDCTIVPGLDVDDTGNPTRPAEASLVVVAGVDVATSITIERSICGGLLVPAQADVVIADSVIQSTDIAGAGPAAVAPTVGLVVVSDPLGPFPTLGAAPNEVVVLAGDSDPDVVDVGTPADLAALAAVLTQPGAFTAVAAGDRLVIVGAAGAPVSVRSHGTDTTAVDLTLTSATSSRLAVRSAPVPVPLTISAAAPAVALRTETGTLVELSLGAVPTDLANAATQLQAAIRASSTDLVHAAAIVMVDDDALVVVPGVPGSVFAFAATGTDPTTAGELGLLHRLPAIASDGNGSRGPALTADRATFFGPVALTVLHHAGDCLFVDPVVAARAQQGCVRFSYLAPGSRPPRRYRCLPDHGCNPVAAFRSTRWGSPDYAALATSAAPLRSGSSTGNEMGAFAGFQHRNREDNLRHQLDEFVRFSMEAGLLDGRSSRHVGGQP